MKPSRHEWPAVSHQLDQAALAHEGERPKTARMPMMGVRKSLQASPVGAAWRCR
jgi:hypothetical protein